MEFKGKNTFASEAARRIGRGIALKPSGKKRGGNAELLFDNVVWSMCCLRRAQTPADIVEG